MSIDTKSNTGLPILSTPLGGGAAGGAATAVGGSETGGRGATISKAGTIVSAVVASSCCWLPLLLLAVGVSGAGIASTLAAWRPVFMVVTFGFLGAAFYFTYRPKRAAATSGCCATAQPEVDCCGRPIVKAADCCSAPAAAKKPRISMEAVNKGMLWVVAAMAIVFLFFPGFLTNLMGAGGGTVTDDMHKTTLKVAGMTCEGGAPTAAEAILKAPGVLAVDVDYESGLAIVGTEPGDAVPEEAVLASLASIGFSGEFVAE